MRVKEMGKRLVAFLLAVFMVFTMNTTALAASGSQQRSASGKITIALASNTSGSSNIVTFNFSSLPSGAVVKRIVVSTPLSRHSGTDAIRLDGYCIAAPQGEIGYFPVYSGSSMTIYAFEGVSAKGTWSMYLDATCLGSGIPPYWAPYFDPVPIFNPVYSSNVYYPAKMTIYYTY